MPVLYFIKRLHLGLVFIVYILAELDVIDLKLFIDKKERSAITGWIGGMKVSIFSLKTLQRLEAVQIVCHSGHC